MVKRKPKGYKGKTYKVAPRGHTKKTYKLKQKWKRILKNMKKPKKLPRKRRVSFRRLV